MLATGIDRRSQDFARTMLDRPRYDDCPAWWDIHDEIRQRIGTGTLTGLCGPWGTGKTVMVAAILWRMCEQGGFAPGTKPRYISAPDFFRRLQECFKPDGPTEGEVLEPFQSSVLLVVDEAHERANTDYEDRRLTELVNWRYGRSLDTLLISNQSASQFAKSIGPAIIDRMNQCGGLIECNWPSYRRGEA